MHARDLVTSEPFVVTVGESVSRAAEIMREADVGLLPVVDNRRDMRLLGVITDRDIVIRCVAAKRDLSSIVREHMTAGPLATVHPDADCHEVLATMSRAQVRRLPVLDDDGRVIGVVALADLALKLGPKEPLHLARTLERISERAPALR